jgi:isocitrate dehydrogenase (NAD+)
VKRRYKIGIIPGDGIGRDVIKSAKIVLDAVNDVSNEFTLDFTPMDVGEVAVEKYGNPFPNETLEGIRQQNAVLFGATTGKPGPFSVVQAFRRGFDLYSNIRPIKALPGIKAIQPHTDLIIVRENTEGLFRKVGYIDGDQYVNLRVFTKKGMERIIRFCFNFAMKERRKKITFTHRANILYYTDKPMREMFYEIAKEFPSIEAGDMEVDNCAMNIVMKPEKFDVILAENANGDILSDVGAGVIGGLGFAPGANIGDAMAVFEPIHGSAPKYADQNIVNPIATILAAKMMVNYLGESGTALQIEEAVKDVLLEGKVRTFDIGGTSSTTEVGEAIAEKIRKKERVR